MIRSKKKKKRQKMMTEQQQKEMLTMQQMMIKKQEVLWWQTARRMRLDLRMMKDNEWRSERKEVVAVVVVVAAIPSNQPVLAESDMKENHTGMLELAKTKQDQERYDPSIGQTEIATAQDEKRDGASLYKHPCIEQANDDQEMKRQANAVQRGSDV